MVSNSIYLQKSFVSKKFKKEPKDESNSFLSGFFFNPLYRHYSISVIFDLTGFIILSYFPPL